MAKWINTVPQGVIGTGNATVFNNPVAAQFGNQLAGLRQREQQQALLQQKAAEDMAKSFRDNQLAASEGRLWADQVSKAEQSHYQKGIDLKQKGINPYGTSPEALNYQKEQRQVQSLQGYRKAQEAQYNALIKQIQAKGVENFEPEDIAKLNEFVSKGNLNDSYSGNIQLPSIRERFSPNSLLKDFKAVTQNDVDTKGNVKSDRKFLDKEATLSGIIGRLNSDPRGQQFLNKITNGIPIPDLMNMPKSIEENRKLILDEYNQNKPLRQKLATDAGIVGEGEELNKWVNEMAKVRANARNNFDSQMDNFIANSTSGLTLWDRNTPDYTEANYNERVRSNNLREQEARNKKSEGVNSEDYEIEYNYTLKTEPTYKDGKIVGESKDLLPFGKAVKVRSVTFPSTQIPSALVVSSGKNERVDSKGDMKLAKIGWTTVKGGGQQIKAILVDSDNEQYIVGEQEVPIDIRKGKPYIAAKQALGSPPSVQSAPTKPATNKSPVTEPEIDRSKFKYQSADGTLPIWSNDGKNWVDWAGRKATPSKGEKVIPNQFKPATNTPKVQDLRIKYNY